MNALAWGLPAAWLVTFAVHSTFLLLGTWLACRLLRGLSDCGREVLWRVAIFGALATATAQTVLVEEPLGGHFAAVESASATTPEIATEALPGAPAPPPEVDLPAPWAAPDPGASFPRDPRAAAWPGLLVAGAALSGLLAVLRLLLQRLRLGRVLSGRHPVADPASRERLRLWQRSAGVRTVRLTKCDALGTPVAFGVLRPEICLPERVLELDAGQRHAIVAHELAHLSRRDPLWLGLSAFLRALFWWQPLYRIAHSRLQGLAEFRSDALALRWTEQDSLAGALVEVAAWLRPSSALPVGLPAMAARPSVLRARVERILGGNVRHGRHRPVLGVLAAVFALAILTATLPGARWESGGTAPGAVEWEMGNDAAGGDSRGNGQPMGELLVAFDRERALLAEEIDALRADLAGLPAHHELRALMNRLEERVTRMDRTREALGDFLAGREADEREPRNPSRGER